MFLEYAEMFGEPQNGMCMDITHGFVVEIPCEGGHYVRKPTDIRNSEGDWYVRYDYVPENSASK